MIRGRAIIIQGNALALPLPDASVDLICTSPPYFGLRSYQDTPELCARCKQLIGQLPPYGNDYHRNLREAWPDWDAHVAEFHKPIHYDGQIGSEATPQEFLDALIAATREMVRVLKPSGSIFVNLGDKYAGGGGQWEKDERDNPRRVTNGSARTVGSGGKTYGLRSKSLIGIPWRYAIRCIDELGLILRAEIIWSKPNGLPESVTDRVRRSHEQWFHLTKQPRYFAAVDEIREEAETRKGAMSWAERRAAGEPTRRGEQGANDATINGMAPNPLGKLPGSVWTVPTQPLTVPPELGVDHFAAYPMEWPRRIIQGFTPTGICTECGEGRRPLITKVGSVKSGGGVNPELNNHPLTRKPGQDRENFNSTTLGMSSEFAIAGYACGCDTNRLGNPIRPAVVLDPFGGTGTTAIVAKALGRTGITIDLSSDYCRLAEWRCNDPRELASALQIDKPEPVPQDQQTLFDDDSVTARPTPERQL